MISTKGQRDRGWDSGHRGPEGQWAQRTRGTVGTEDQRDSGHRGTVGTAGPYVGIKDQRDSGHRGPEGQWVQFGTLCLACVAGVQRGGRGEVEYYLVSKRTRMAPNLWGSLMETSVNNNGNLRRNRRVVFTKR